MRKQQICLLVVYMLTGVCLCNTLDGTTTTTRPRVDNAEGLERQIAEMQQILLTHMTKLNNLEDAIDDIGIAQHPGSGPPGPPGPPGRDGRDGEDGEAGSDGRDGEDGEAGSDGRDGEDGEAGRDGRDGEDGKDGEAGRDGKDGRDGIRGPQGLPGNAGDPGVIGPKGDQAGGAIYTRWGRTTCGSDSTLIYVGFTGKTYYTNKGGGINYQCMVNDAEYNSDATGTYYATLSGTEYQSYNYGVFENEASQQNAPCAVCYANNKISTLMVPGKRSCPTDWHKEYEGYLMSAYHGHESPSTYECVDENPEYIRGEAANNDGGLLYFNKAVCTQGVHCPEYDANKAITCVVCTN